MYTPSLRLVGLGLGVGAGIDDEVVKTRCDEVLELVADPCKSGTYAQPASADGQGNRKAAGTAGVSHEGTIPNLR